jgi:hypothetical protein
MHKRDLNPANFITLYLSKIYSSIILLSTIDLVSAIMQVKFSIYIAS